jgi:hypothetical protein
MFVAGFIYSYIHTSYIHTSLFPRGWIEYPCHMVTYDGYIWLQHRQQRVGERNPLSLG